jgi:hypothetical protein
LLELDKLNDHETHVERHSKHFKKQRKPYLLIFVKKPWETLSFRLSQYVASSHTMPCAARADKNMTCIWRGKIQGEMHVARIARSRIKCTLTVVDVDVARMKFFLKDQ